MHEKGQSSTSRRVMPTETESQPTARALTNSGEVTMDTIPALEDASPIGFPSPVEGRGELVRASVMDQLQATQLAQQMYCWSEIQKYEGVIQSLVAEMRELQQEDEGSEMRIQELERQRDTACQVMQHMNNVNREMEDNFQLAIARITEESQAQRQHDHMIAEELAQRLHQERNEAAQGLVQLEERAQGDGMLMAREYEKLTTELHERAKENLHLRAGMAESEHAVISMRERLLLAKNEENTVADDAMHARVHQELVNSNFFVSVLEKKKNFVSWRCEECRWQKINYGTRGQRKASIADYA